MNQKRSKREFHYTIIAVPNSSSKAVKRFCLKKSSIIVASVIGMFFATTLIISVLLIGRFLNIERENENFTKISQEELQKIKEENISLINTNKEINEKIVVLNDTINQRVEEDEILELETMARSVPTGFPLSATATMAKVENPVDPIIVFQAERGTAVIAAGDGKVLECGEDAEYDKVVKIDHGNGYISIYRCDSDFEVVVGQDVTKGTVLFSMNANQPAMAYQIMLEGVYIEPQEVMVING